MTDDIRGNIPFEDWPLYINGQACQPASSAFFEADDPYTGKVWARVARGSAADVDRAVAAAQCAFPAWSGLAPAARARTMDEMGGSRTRVASARPSRHPRIR